MKFEQLLDGATKGEWLPSEILDDGRCGIITKESDIVVGANRNLHKDNAAFIARCNPAVMREVWAALKEVAEPSNWFFDEGAYQMVCRKDVRTRCTRALALLDGQTEKGGAE